MNTSFTAARSRFLFVGLVGLSGLFGCAEEPRPRSAQAEAAAVRGSVYVAPGTDAEGKKLAGRLAAGLARAGHTVVTSDTAEHELTAEILVSVRETSGLLTVYVDGQPKKSHEAEATLKVTAAGQVITGERLKYDADDGPTDEEIQTLVAALSNSAAQKYVAGARRQEGDAIMRQQAKDEAVVRERKQKEDAEKQELLRQDDAAWNQVVVAECVSPTQLTGCDAAKRYLAEYPTGKHVIEAKTALNAGAPNMAKLADERDWLKAGTEACSAPKATTDCDAVKTYLTAQPGGAHAAEAQTLLTKAAPKLAALQKQEEKRAKDEEDKVDAEMKKMEQEEKRQARDQCKKECIGGPCFSLRPGSFEICMDRCVKASCD